MFFSRNHSKELCQPGKPRPRAVSSVTTPFPARGAWLRQTKREVSKSLGTWVASSPLSSLGSTLQSFSSTPSALSAWYKGGGGSPIPLRELGIRFLDIQWTGAFSDAQDSVLWVREVTLGLRLRGLGLIPCLAAWLVGHHRQLTISCKASPFSSVRDRDTYLASLERAGECSGQRIGLWSQTNLASQLCPSLAT